ncbi:MAG: GNAT family N-acetyltransferase [Acidobacteria bacterium]|nr:GNAT family N-acetyltransferase [Acidobacteriota bacterium]
MVAEFKISLGTSGQVADLIEIEQLALQSFQDPEVRQWFLQHPTPPEILHSAIRDNCLWVVELSSGGLAGFADVTYLGAVPYLAGLYVHPQFSRQGIGSALLVAILSELKGRECVEIWLTTTSNHPWHQPFYELHGFQVAEETILPAEIQVMLQIEARMGWRTRRIAMRRIL